MFKVPERIGNLGIKEIVLTKDGIKYIGYSADDRLNWEKIARSVLKLFEHFPDGTVSVFRDRPYSFNTFYLYLSLYGPKDKIGIASNNEEELLQKLERFENIIGIKKELVNKMKILLPQEIYFEYEDRLNGYYKAYVEVNFIIGIKCDVFNLNFGGKSGYIGGLVFEINSEESWICFYRGLPKRKHEEEFVLLEKYNMHDRTDDLPENFLETFLDFINENKRKIVKLWKRKLLD